MTDDIAQYMGAAISHESVTHKTSNTHHQSSVETFQLYTKSLSLYFEMC